MKCIATLLLFAAALSAVTAFAQPRSNDSTSYVFRCATDEALRARRLADPALSRRMEANDRLLYTLISAAMAERHDMRAPHADVVYTIPVVIHIVHNGGAENITDAQVQQGLRDMNDAFRNVGVYDPATGVDVEIAFCLAKQDPDGKPTSGITRTQSPLTNLAMESDDIPLKDLTRWNPEHYLNIWLVREITSTSSGPGVAGYAYLPASHGRPEDGIVGEARWFGSSPANTAILVHEAGHYFGLYHTFQGGCTNNDCLIDGDAVCDTPPDQSVAEVSCRGQANSCSSDPDDPSPKNPFRSPALGGLGDVPDLHTDYMDYGNPACFSVFTAGQRDRMRAVLTSIRSSLLASHGCTSPCPNPFTPSFTVPPGTIYVGSPVSFTNTTSGANSFTWSVDGTTFSTAASPTYTFTSAGRHVVTLTAASDDPLCTFTTSDTIDVRCRTVAGFTISSATVKPGESISATSTSTNADSYVWLVDGVQVSVGPDLTTTFPSEGAVRITLIAQGPDCSDTATRVLQVRQCGTDKHGNVWYFGFGGNGLNFNTPDSRGYPAPISGGGGSNREGFASICDQNGAVMFYTDGRTIYDGRHRSMYNTLNGGVWAAQVLIVPMPGNPDLYYVFSVNNWTDTQAELRYTVVDMRLNGGRGEVTQGNVTIHSNAAECVVGAYHANCKDVWIVTHEKGTNNYVAFLLTSSGISTQPVISSVGSDLVGANRYGSLRFSQDTRWLCRALGGGSAASPTLELNEFDNATGKVSNAMPIADDTLLPSPFSAEFSPNGRYLYTANFTKGPIYQFDLQAASGGGAAILASRVPVGTYDGGCFVLGPDGRIYISQYNTGGLAVIDYPNLPGTACHVATPPIPYPGQSSLGLQNLVAGMYGRGISLRAAATACAGADVKVTAAFVGCEVSSVRWRAIGPGTITASDDKSATLRLDDTGIVRVVVERTDACTTTLDSIDVRATPGVATNLGPDTALCSIDSLTLDAGAGFASYSWQDGSTRQRFTARAPGTYWVEARTPEGCVARDTIVVGPDAGSPSVNLGADTTLCGGAVLTLDAGPGARAYRWQDGSAQRQFTAFGPGTYWVTITDACGRAATDTIVVAATATTPLLGADTTLCDGNIVTLAAPPGKPRYLWSTGETTDRITASAAGTYWVDVQEPNGCVTRDSIEVTLSSTASTSLGPDTVLCPGTTVTLAPSTTGASYRWSTGATSPSISVGSAGEYWLELWDAAGCVARDTVRVEVDRQLLDLSLGTDTTLCGRSPLLLDAGAGFAGYRWSDGSAGRTLTATQPGRYWVEVNGRCGTARDTIDIRQGAPPIDLGPDTLVCARDAITLTAPEGGTSYRWSTGETTRDIRAADSGDYWVEMWKDGCVLRDTVHVATYPGATLTASVAEIGPSTDVVPGDTLVVTLRLASSPARGAIVGAAYRAVLRFDRTMLFPIAPTPRGPIDGTDRVITLSGTVPNSDTRALLPFRGLFGRDAGVDVRIDSFEIADDCIAGIIRLPGHATIVACGAGRGLLTIELTDRALLKVASEVVEGRPLVVTYRTVEIGPTQLVLTDARGAIVRRLYDGGAEVGSFTLEVPTEGIPSGVYSVQLRTPSDRKSVRVLVTK